MATTGEMPDWFKKGAEAALLAQQQSISRNLKWKLRMEILLSL